MVLGLRIQSGTTGRPPPAKSQYGQARRDKQSTRGEQSESRGNSALSAIAGRDRASQSNVRRNQRLALESGSQSQQAPIEGGHMSSLAGTQNLLNSSVATGSASCDSDALLRASSTSAQRSGRASRPYTMHGKQEALTLNPTGRFENTDSRSKRHSIFSREFEDLDNSINQSQSKKLSDEGLLLPHLSEREIVDVSDNGKASNATATVTHPALDERPTRSSNRGQSDVLPKGARSNASANVSTHNRITPLRQSDASQVATAPRQQARVPNSRLGQVGDEIKRPSGLYLGGLDLEQVDFPPQQPAMRSRDVFSQPTTADRHATFNLGSTSSHKRSSTYRTAVTDYGPQVLHRIPAQFGPPFYDVYGCGRGYHCWDIPISSLPWQPCHVVQLPSQTIFTEISTDYFEHEGPPIANVDNQSGLEIINRYYTGWRDAYNKALSGNYDISEADMTDIASCRQKLHVNHNEAVRRLRSGDPTVVEKTLDQVKMDRQMAVDMPVDQARWSTPWIQEVWRNQHGEIPG